MSLRLTSNLAEIQRLGVRLNALGNLDRAALLEGIAAEVESQTRRRLSDEKEAPDGTPWPEWSDNYAATRQSQHSLLESSGSLIDSIESVVSDDRAETGSNLIYAAIHNLGGTDDMAPGPAAIPQREFIGLSDGNLIDLQHLVDDFTDDHIRQALGLSSGGLS